MLREYSILLKLNGMLLYRHKRTNLVFFDELPDGAVRDIRLGNELNKLSLIYDIENILFDPAFENLVNGYCDLSHKYYTESRKVDWSLGIRPTLTLEIDRGYGCKIIKTMKMSEYDDLIARIYGNKESFGCVFDVSVVLKQLRNLGFDLHNPNFKEMFKTHAHFKNIEIKEQNLPPLEF